MGQLGWGGPSTGPTLFFGAAGVSPCRCEPLRAGCCGGRGCLVFRRGKLIIILVTCRVWFAREPVLAPCTWFL